MSRASKITFGVTSAVTGLIILVVHNTQQAEQEAMHAGVIRDEERVRIKRERAEDFALSEKMRQEYEKVQPVTRKGQGGEEAGGAAATK